MYYIIKMTNMKKFTTISVTFSDICSGFKFEDQKYYLGQNNKLVELDLKNARVFTEQDMPEIDVFFKFDLLRNFIKVNPQYKNISMFDFDVTINPTTYKIG